MTAIDRPNPDALLAAIQSDAAQKQRGRLKVFLGMCPGVGKTYAMLEAAQRELKAGRDVVIGYVETHGRKETDALTAGLPLMPRVTSEHRGINLTEMDLDAVLSRHPKLALGDALAHTNAPGSRHPKRWQDVKELLDAGIDVFTTLNVQHLESRADTVRQITGAEIRETVPDSLLDAASLELVDLPPADLVVRLQQGKVYLAERAASAAQNFFRESNLTALRELSLRLVADHVGADTQEYHRQQAGQGVWKTGAPADGGGERQSVFGIADPLDAAHGGQSEMSVAGGTRGEFASAGGKHPIAAGAKPGAGAFAGGGGD